MAKATVAPKGAGFDPLSVIEGVAASTANKPQKLGYMDIIYKDSDYVMHSSVYGDIYFAVEESRQHDKYLECHVISPLGRFDIQIYNVTGDKCALYMRTKTGVAEGKTVGQSFQRSAQRVRGELVFPVFAGRGNIEPKPETYAVVWLDFTGLRDEIKALFMSGAFVQLDHKALGVARETAEERKARLDKYSAEHQEDAADVKVDTETGTAPAPKGDDFEWNGEGEQPTA